MRGNLLRVRVRERCAIWGSTLPKITLSFSPLNWGIGYVYKVEGERFWPTMFSLILGPVSISVVNSLEEFRVRLRDDMVISYVKKEAEGGR